MFFNFIRAYLRKRYMLIGPLIISKAVTNWVRPYSIANLGINFFRFFQATTMPQFLFSTVPFIYGLLNKSSVPVQNPFFEMDISLTDLSNERITGYCTHMDSINCACLKFCMLPSYFLVNCIFFKRDYVMLVYLYFCCVCFR